VVHQFLLTDSTASFYALLVVCYKRSFFFFISYSDVKRIRNISIEASVERDRSLSDLLTQVVEGKNLVRNNRMVQQQDDEWARNKTF
jgi:hypothetical protein